MVTTGTNQTAKQSQDRYSGLDYLRGLAAFGIMIYHYISWSYGKIDSSHALGRIGIYGVSIFYVLSGLTLFLVYKNKLESNLISITDFFIKRFFRIFPLLWVITTITIIIKPISYSWLKIFLNYTGLFSLFAWTDYIGAGVWSIGNELAFYLIFPFLILSLNSSRILFYIIGVFAFTAYIFFAFYLYDNSTDLKFQWGIYTNPLNQFFLFWGGVAIGHLTQNVELKSVLAIALFLFAATIFIFFPSNGDNIAIVTSSNRIVFSVLCFIATFAFYKISKINDLVHRPLSFLGEISYSVYLTHPLVFKVAGFMQLSINPTLKILVSVIASFTISYIIYTFIEKPFISIGKRIAHRIASKRITNIT